jgi:preprotein translocase subunit YajC
VASLLLLAGFVVVFYFLLWRPQAKRAKEQRNLIANLAKGDEVAMSGGLLGKITRLDDDFITLAIADNVEVKVQKNAVALVLPKGTLR